MDSFAGSARDGFGDDFSDCRRAQEICGPYQVVGMPLHCRLALAIIWPHSIETDSLTMSSGSSGRSVALPAPVLRSMFCLISLIVTNGPAPEPFAELERESVDVEGRVPRVKTWWGLTSAELGPSRNDT